MTRKQLWYVIALIALLGVMGCEKPAPTPPSAQRPSSPVEATPKTPEVAPAVAPDVAELAAAPKADSSEQSLPEVCTKLLTCCDAWVKVTPTAQVGCDAQRHAFRAAKTPEAKAKLGDLCEQALAAWAQLTDIPELCK
jgi:hypothetical protein